MPKPAEKVEIFPCARAEFYALGRERSDLFSSPDGVCLTLGICFPLSQCLCSVNMRGPCPFFCGEAHHAQHLPRRRISSVSDSWPKFVWKRSWLTRHDEQSWAHSLPCEGYESCPIPHPILSFFGCAGPPIWAASRGVALVNIILSINQAATIIKVWCSPHTMILFQPDPILRWCWPASTRMPCRHSREREKEREREREREREF